MSWRDLFVVARQSSGDTASALFRSLNPDWRWDVSEQLLHSVEHSVRVLAWQQTKDGMRGRNVPKPVPAPWVPTENDTVTYGSGAVDLDEMAEWLRSRGVRVGGG